MLCRLCALITIRGGAETECVCRKTGIVDNRKRFILLPSRVMSVVATVTEINALNLRNARNLIVDAVCAGSMSELQVLLSHPLCKLFQTGNDNGILPMHQVGGVPPPRPPLLVS